MAETSLSKVQRGAKLESGGAKHPLAPLRSAYDQLFKYAKNFPIIIDH